MRRSKRVLAELALSHLKHASCSRPPTTRLPIGPFTDAALDDQGPKPTALPIAKKKELQPLSFPDIPTVAVLHCVTVNLGTSGLSSIVMHHTDID